MSQYQVNVTAAANTAGTTTTFNLPSLLQAGNYLVPAESVTLVVANPTGSGQTISSASLIFTDTVGGVASTITYTLSAVSIAAGANQTFLVVLSSGYFSQPSLSLTYGSNPSASTITAEAIYNSNIGGAVNSATNIGTVAILGVPAAAALADNAANPTTITVGANISAWDGSAWDRVRSISVYKDLNTVNVTANTAVWNTSGGKKFRLMGGSFSANNAGSVLFQDGVGGATVWRTPILATNSPYNFDLGEGKQSGTANNSIYATLSVNGSITGMLYGVDDL